MNKHVKDEIARQKVKDLIAKGVYGYHELFDTVYKEYTGHYSVLRKIVQEVKNGY